MEISQEERDIIIKYRQLREPERDIIKGALNIPYKEKPELDALLWYFDRMDTESRDHLLTTAELCYLGASQKRQEQKKSKAGNAYRAQLLHYWEKLSEETQRNLAGFVEYEYKGQAKAGAQDPEKIEQGHIVELQAYKERGKE